MPIKYTQQRAVNMFKNMFEKALKYKIFWTNLGPMSFKIIFRTYLGPMSVELIFYAPNVANLGFWKIGPTITL